MSGPRALGHRPESPLQPRPAWCQAPPAGAVTSRLCAPHTYLHIYSQGHRGSGSGLGQECCSPQHSSVTPVIPTSLMETPRVQEAEHSPPHRHQQRSTHDPPPLQRGTAGVVAVAHRAPATLPLATSYSAFSFLCLLPLPRIFLCKRIKTKVLLERPETSHARAPSRPGGELTPPQQVPGAGGPLTQHSHVGSGDPTLPAYPSGLVLRTHTHTHTGHAHTACAHRIPTPRPPGRAVVGCRVSGQDGQGHSRFRHQVPRSGLPLGPSGTTLLGACPSRS